MRATLVPTRLVPSSHRYLAEQLEQRLLLASLLDLVGKKPIGSQFGASSQSDDLWLANHVSVPTLKLLDKVDGPLQQMYVQALRDGSSFADMSIGNSSPAAQFVHQGDSPLVTIRSADPTALADRLVELGFNVSGSAENGDAGVVDVYTPVSRIAELAGVPGVKSVGAEQNLPTDAGSVSSTWPGTANIPQLLLDRPGLTGAGITYGIISDSFNALGGMAAGIASGDLPAGTTVLHDNAFGTDEGRAMAEVLYDAAPGSNILFYDAEGGKTGMVTAINALVTAGADVIVDDVNVTEGTFQDDVVSQAIDNVVLNNKVPYFTSSGNRNGQTYYGNFNDGSVVDNFHAFDGANDEGLTMTIPNNGTLTADLWWGQKLGGATTDLDLYLSNDNTGVNLAQNTDDNLGGDAFTNLSYTNTTGSTITASLDIYHYTGPVTNLPMFLLIFPGKGTTPNDNEWGGPASYGHHEAEDGFGIAAVKPTSPDTIESYSSLGGVPTLFNDDGTPISGGSVTRAQPSFAAADGINTTFFGQFFGTSCAAPDAAAIGGLLLQAAGGPQSLTHDQMRDMLSNSSFDLGSAGYDYTFGAGRIDALGSAIAAQQNLGSGSYLELNQFGQGSLATSMATDISQPSVDFAFDAAGTANQLQTVSGAFVSYGALFEYGDPGAANLLQTNRVDFLVGSFTGWTVAADTRHSLSTFARQDLGSSSVPMSFLVDGPDAPLTSISLDSTTATGGVNASLGSNYDTAYYQFTTPATFDTASGVNIGASFTGMDGVISVFDASGTQLLRADSHGTGVAENLSSTTFATNTTYIIRIGSYLGHSHGSFSLRIRAAKSLAGGILNVGTTFSTLSVLVPDGATDTSPNNAVGQFYTLPSVNNIAGYAFGADSQLGGTFTIDVTSTQLDPVIAVYAYNGIFGSSLGEMVAFNDDFSGHNSHVTFTAQPGVRHILAVKSFDSNNGNGTYNISASYGGAASESSIGLNANGDGSISTGSIAAGGEVNTYKFTTPANLDEGPHTITLTNQNGNGDIYVFDNSGNLIGGDSNGGTGDETITLNNLVANSTYHITVMPELYAAALGAATININLRTLPAALTSAPDLFSLDDLGVSDSDNLTSQNTNLRFLVSGVSPGQYVRLFRNGLTIAGPSQVSSGFNFIVLTIPGPIVDGAANYTTDLATSATGPQTAVSPALSVTIDTVRPANPIVEFHYDEGAQDQYFRLVFGETIYSLSLPTVQNLTTSHTIDASNLSINPINSSSYQIGYNPTSGNDQLPTGNYEFRMPVGTFADAAGNTNNPQNITPLFFQEADANHDRYVNTLDFTALAQNFNKTNATFSRGDFNYDGKVNAIDFNILASKFGTYLAPPASGATVARALNSSPVAAPAAVQSLFGDQRIDREPSILA